MHFLHFYSLIRATAALIVTVKHDLCQEIISVYNHGLIAPVFLARLAAVRNIDSA
jgi:hypothetical protein